MWSCTHCLSTSLRLESGKPDRLLGTTYGQTEAPQILTVMRPEDFEDPRNWAAVGRTTWFSDVAIMAPDGRLMREVTSTSRTV